MTRGNRLAQNHGGLSSTPSKSPSPSGNPQPGGGNSQPGGGNLRPPHQKRDPSKSPEEGRPQNRQRLGTPGSPPPTKPPVPIWKPSVPTSQGPPVGRYGIALPKSDTELEEMKAAAIRGEFPAAIRGLPEAIQKLSEDVVERHQNYLEGQRKLWPESAVKAMGNELLHYTVERLTGGPDPSAITPEVRDAWNKTIYSPDSSGSQEKRDD